MLRKFDGCKYDPKTMSYKNETVYVIIDNPGKKLDKCVGVLLRCYDSRKKAQIKIPYSNCNSKNIKHYILYENLNVITEKEYKSKLINNPKIPLSIRLTYEEIKEIQKEIGKKNFDKYPSLKKILYYDDDIKKMENDL